jgi:hypothetical protein
VEREGQSCDSDSSADAANGWSISWVAVARFLHPVQSDWKRYGRMMRSCGIPQEAIVAMLGNHDLRGRLSLENADTDHLLHPITTLVKAGGV